MRIHLLPISGFLLVTACDLPNTVCHTSDDCFAEHTCVTPNEDTAGLCKRTDTLSPELRRTLAGDRRGQEGQACFEGTCDAGLDCLDDVCVTTSEPEPNPVSIQEFSLGNAFVVDESPRPMLPEEQVELMWETDNAEGCTVSYLGSDLDAPSDTASFLLRLTQTGTVTLRCEGPSGEATDALNVVVDPAVIRITDAGFFADNESNLTSTYPRDDVSFGATVDGNAEQCEILVDEGAGETTILAPVVDGRVETTLVVSEGKTYRARVSCLHVEKRVESAPMTLTVSSPSLAWGVDAATQFQVLAGASLPLDFVATAVSSCSVFENGASVHAFETPANPSANPFIPPLGVHAYSLRCAAGPVNLTPLPFTAAVVSIEGLDVLSGIDTVGVLAGPVWDVNFTVDGAGTLNQPDCTLISDDTDRALMTFDGSATRWNGLASVTIPLNANADNIDLDATLRCDIIDDDASAIELPLRLLRAETDFAPDFLGAPNTAPLGSTLSGTLTVSGMTECTVTLTRNTDVDPVVQGFNAIDVDVRTPLDFAFSPVRLDAVLSYSCLGADGSTYSNALVLETPPPPAEVAISLGDFTDNGTSSTQDFVFNMSLDEVHPDDLQAIECGIRNDPDTAFTDAPAGIETPHVVRVVRVDSSPVNLNAMVNIRCQLSGPGVGTTLSLPYAVGARRVDEVTYEALDIVSLPDDIAFVMGSVEVLSGIDQQSNQYRALQVIADVLVISTAFPPVGAEATFLDRFHTGGGMEVVTTNGGRARTCAFAERLYGQTGDAIEILADGSCTGLPEAP